MSHLYYMKPPNSSKTKSMLNCLTINKRTKTYKMAEPVAVYLKGIEVFDVTFIKIFRVNNFLKPDFKFAIHPPSSLFSDIIN